MTDQISFLLSTTITAWAGRCSQCSDVISSEISLVRNVVIREDIAIGQIKKILNIRFSDLYESLYEIADVLSCIANAELPKNHLQNAEVGKIVAGLQNRERMYECGNLIIYQSENPIPILNFLAAPADGEIPENLSYLIYCSRGRVQHIPDILPFVFTCATSCNVPSLSDTAVHGTI
ncbi:hypothetical protein Bhyg_12901 [Pseudolycoriella hygida]|uniref:Uncharacterized protein n=1 Tax=Pseudolycoriella hygida TaxID=35572 RepID=A0A9Q0N0G4_9DIPT|nr:hypothetical protein Bhyg_12901 [Pseudolycoriella hygida]